MKIHDFLQVTRNRAMLLIPPALFCMLSMIGITFLKWNFFGELCVSGAIFITACSILFWSDMTVLERRHQKEMDDFIRQWDFFSSSLKQDLLNRQMENEKIPKKVREAREFAVKSHKNVNHLYDEKPYSTHLKMVYEAGMKFIHLVPEELREEILSACWTHDTIEDCRLTYNDLKKELGEGVAEITYALTNDKGKTREERAGEGYYKGIRETPYATYVKLCDRIANFQYSLSIQGRMAEVYTNEMENFLEKVVPKNSPVDYTEMIEFLKSMKTA